MRNWLIFLKERLPLPILFTLSAGLGLSSLSLDGEPLAAIKILIAIAAAGLFLLTLRFMDEVKDYAKDQLVHPERPLPRGLLSVAAVQRAIYLGLLAMLALAYFMMTQGHPLAARLYGFSTAYLWLMYKEFFIGQKLEKMPFLYAITHQVIILPLAASTRALQNEVLSLSLLLEPGLMLIGVFFSYEICRKLDPQAHRALQTYRHHYGEGRTFLLIALTSSLALWGDYLLFAHTWQSLGGLWLLALSVPVLYVLALRRNYKLVEAAASLSLLIHIWWPFVRHMLGD